MGESPGSGRDRTSAPRRRSAFLWAAGVGVVVMALVGIALFLTVGNNPIVPAQASPGSDASLPTIVDGLGVLTVSEAIGRRDAGVLGDDPVAIRGYWSDASVGHSCAPPRGPTGELEIYCHDREWGITELNEPIEVIDRGGFVTEGVGPWLTPFVENELPGSAALFSLPIVNGQRFPPVPIVVIGHFDDPRAADCRPEATEICRDRLVIDRIVHFEPASVAPPAPTPSPTAFPFADPPSAPYAVDQCAEGHPIEFAGWSTLASLGIDIGASNEPAYIVITKEPIPIGDWYDDPNDGTRYRLWGQRVCYAHEWEEGAIGYTSMPGTQFREYPDGRHEPTVGP
jgi:hypothetical protein